MTEPRAPLYGSLGVLAVAGDRVQCHLCGRWLRSVGVHAWQAHGLLADEYRATFGLNRTHGLDGPDTFAKKGAHGRAMIARYGSKLPADAPHGHRRPYRLEARRAQPDRDALQAATKRRDVCPRGHSMTDAYVKPDGKRRCRECARVAEHDRYLRARGR